MPGDGGEILRTRDASNDVFPRTTTNHFSVSLMASLINSAMHIHNDCANKLLMWTAQEKSGDWIADVYFTENWVFNFSPSPLSKY